MTNPSPAAADSAASAAVRIGARIGARVRAGARTGGPQDDGPRILEQILGWTLVVVLAVFVTRAGMM
ncbi:SCO1431 family membrane protein [Streptomyces laurentii]|uniref:SCO1431 family membrane protein n=1 Tax=Streptomyces laurentii TaxID=39478 RepID=UPI00368D9813